MTTSRAATSWPTGDDRPDRHGGAHADSRRPQVVIKRSHAWLNGFGKLRWCTERRHACAVFWLALACVVVIIRRLVRHAWTQYRWDDQPIRRP